uniref:LisH domain-containing protein n=2 Tax=Hymenolepis diminuta TaxID=6216 RepID=A0A0R3SN75_HYMDI
LLDIMRAMLYLIEHPNFDSANNGYAHVDDISELEMKTKLLLAGLEVNGSAFQANEAWCEWARENNCLPTEEDEKRTKESESQIPSTSKCTEDDERDIKDDDTPHISLPTIEEINIDENDDYSITSSETALTDYYLILTFLNRDSIRNKINKYRKSFL